MLQKVGQSILSSVSTQDYSEGIKATVGMAAAITTLAVLGATIYYSNARQKKAVKTTDDSTWTNIAVGVVAYVLIDKIGNLLSQSTTPRPMKNTNPQDFAPVW